MRKWIAAFTSLVLAVSLTACSSAKPTEGSAPAASGSESRPLKKVSLILDWYPNAVHTPIYVAQKEGFFKAEGIDLEIKMPAENPTDGIKLVGGGKETFALYYQPDVLLARAEGIPIVSVAAVVRQPLNVVMVTEESGVKSPRDLEGKVVGFPSIPLNLNLVNTMVKTAGGDPAKVKFQDIGWDLIPALAGKKVAAISGGYLNHEKLLLEKEGHKIKAFSPKDFGVPNYYELVLIAGEQTGGDTELVNAFWRAMTRGFEKTKADQKGALEVLLAAQAKEFPLEKEIEVKSLAILVPLMETAGAKFGAQSEADWQKVADWMTGQSILKGVVKPADAFRNIVK